MNPSTPTSVDRPDTKPGDLPEEIVQDRTLVDDGSETPSAQREALEEAAQSKKAAAEMSEIERMDAVEWFLSDDPDEAVATRTLRLNVSTNPDKVTEIKWVVQAVARERIQQIRDEARNQPGKRRRQRASQGEDTGNQALANLKIAAEGTAYPDLRDPRLRREFLDPSDAMAYRFRNKPGLIDQVAAHVIEVSGYDEDDVQEIAAVKT
jgi:Phage XkdN-like tail assembly chaperone protein, TAC